MGTQSACGGIAQSIWDAIHCSRICPHRRFYVLRGRAGMATYWYLPRMYRKTRIYAETACPRQGLEFDMTNSCQVLLQAERTIQTEPPRTSALH